MNKQRPKHLALHLIKQPLPAIVSILHRVSGLILFCALPLLLLMLQYSLKSIETYTQLAEILGNPYIKIMLIGLLWAFLHHFCAGLRHLAWDAGLGFELPQVHRSGRAVVIATAVLTLLTWIVGVAVM